MRLIDADELLKRVDEERKYLIARGQTGAEHILVHNFRDLIDNAPTVEAKTTEDCIIAYGDGYETARRLYERPQGEWHYYNNSNVNGYIHDGCKCREEVFDYAYNFCPNCGSKLIEVRGKEE